MYILTSRFPGQTVVPIPQPRTIRNLTALLVSAGGITRIAQLWLRDIDRALLLLAAIGVAYLLLGLGLSGQSRFALWITTAAVLASAAAAGIPSSGLAMDPLLAWHLASDALTAMLCGYLLYRTRDAATD